MFFRTHRMGFPIRKAQHWDSSEKLEEERQIIRKLHLEEVPVSILDVGEVYKINSSYLDCQRYGYQYHCSKLSPLHMRKFEIKLDRPLSTAGNMDRQPIVFPLIRDCGMMLGSIFPMVPMNFMSCDTSYPQRIFVKCVPLYVMEIIVIGIYAALNILCTKIY